MDGLDMLEVVEDFAMYKAIGLALGCCFIRLALRATLKFSSKGSWVGMKNIKPILEILL